MKLEDYLDRIDDYVLDRMPEVERSAFEKEMADNPELQEQVAFMKNMQRAIKSRDEKLAAMNEWEKRRESPVKKTWPYWASGIAAVFVAGLFIVQNQFLSPSGMDANGQLRGTSYHAIDSLIINEQYDDALAEIRDRSLMLANDSAELVNNPQKMQDKERFDYEMELINDQQDELKWLTIQALLGQGRKDDAMTLLDELRHHKGLYQKDAKALYKQLKKEK